jgi:hypothetical protein
MAANSGELRNISLTPETGVRNPYGAPTSFFGVDSVGFFADFCPSAKAGIASL